MVALDPNQRADTRKQLGSIDGLEEKVVGSRLDPLHLLLVAVRRDHDDGKQARGRLVTQAATDLETVDPREHDVEDDEVDVLHRELAKRLVPVAG